MKKQFYSELQTVGASLESFKKRFNIDESLKKMTLYKFWANVAGAKFKDVSKPVSVNKDGILLVACKNSFVTSELFMFKEKILEKLQPYSKSLEISVKDVVFSHKIWQEDKSENGGEEESTAGEEFVYQKPSDEEIDSIVLDEDTLKEVKNAVEKAQFASQDSKEKMFNAIVKNLKEQEYKRRMS